MNKKILIFILISELVIVNCDNDYDSLSTKLETILQKLTLESFKLNLNEQKSFLNLQLNLMKQDVVITKFTEKLKTYPIQAIDSLLSTILKNETLTKDLFAIFNLDRLNDWFTTFFNQVNDENRVKVSEYNLPKNPTSITTATETTTSKPTTTTTHTTVTTTISTSTTTPLTTKNLVITHKKAQLHSRIVGIMDGRNLTIINKTNTTTTTLPTVITNGTQMTDAEVCKYFSLADCVSKPKVTEYCPIKCTCKNIICQNNGTLMMEDKNECKCKCNQFFKGDFCEIKECIEKDFCAYFNKELCNVELIKNGCPRLCGSC